MINAILNSEFNIKKPALNFTPVVGDDESRTKTISVTKADLEVLAKLVQGYKKNSAEEKTRLNGLATRAGVQTSELDSVLSNISSFAAKLKEYILNNPIKSLAGGVTVGTATFVGGLLAKYWAAFSVGAGALAEFLAGLVGGALGGGIALLVVLGAVYAFDKDFRNAANKSFEKNPSLSIILPVVPVI